MIAVQLTKYRRKRLANRAMDSIKATFANPKPRQAAEPAATPITASTGAPAEAPKHD
jgi:hypothetical protein